MSTRAERIAVGEELEKKMAEYIAQTKTIKRTKDSPQWTPLMDLKFGDIEIESSKGSVFIDVKRGSAKGRNGISFKSIQEFIGDYFAFSPYEFEPALTYVVGANVMKKYAQSVLRNGGSIQLPSGDEGFYFYPSSIRAAMKLPNFLKILI